MRILSGDEEKEAINYLGIAGDIALRSLCLRAKCGSVIVKGEDILGIGFNSPPKGLESQRRCLILKDSLDKRVTDKTCCVHAEQRAIFDALKNYPSMIEGSRIYFVRLDKDGKIEFKGEPYCTICSKSALDVGIKEFVLLSKEGIRVYDSEEYNKISFDYRAE